MINLLYSAKHYQIKCAKDREIIEQIYEEVKKSAQTAIFRNIGDIFFTARTDTEINGAVECNGGTYSTADFEGKQNVGNLLANGSLPYVSLDEYESIVSANGSCRCYGWDGGDIFRVPTLREVYIEAGLAAEAEEFISESLPNIRGFLYRTGADDGPITQPSATEGAFTVESNGGNGAVGSGSVAYNLRFDASLSSPVYSDGAKVKPDSVKYRAMVQLANGATDQAVITATSALQQITNKANNDLSNVTNVSQSFKDQSVGWCMPDYSAGVSVELPYTVPFNGFLKIHFTFNAGEAYLYVNNIQVQLVGGGAVAGMDYMIPVSKGDNITRSTTSTYNNGVFYPVKGVN